MINLKISIMIGCTGIVLSLLIGLLAGAGFPLIFIRAGIFGVIFFGLGCGIWVLINNFIPELLHSQAPAEEGMEISDNTPGSRINISVDDSRILTEMYRNLNNDDEVGNIADLVSGAIKPDEGYQAQLSADNASEGMDQISEAGYTGNVNENAQVSSIIQGAAESDPGGGFYPQGGHPQGGMDLPQGGMDLPGGMDLDAVTGSFLGSAVDSGGSIASIEREEQVRRNRTGNKAQKMDGDFNPKELAAGIRTVLNKDE